MNSTPSKFLWYLSGVASQFVPFGIHSVLFAWLIVVHLGEGGVRLGFAQMSAQLPGLVFILFGGLLADRLDRKLILIGFHCLAALPVYLLAISITFGALSYYLLIIVAIAIGTFNAFIQPARDSLLNQVAGSNLQKAVTLTMGLSFAAQIVGYGVASRADAVGPVPLLIIQGTLLLLGAVFATRLPSSMVVRDSLQGAQERTRKGPLADIGDGLALMFRSKRMAPVMVLMFAVGIFYMGAFSVINPLVVRDVYGGAAADIALSYICFMVGTIFSTALLVAFGGIKRQGLGLMSALAAGGICLAITNLGLPFYGYLICLGMWGICGGIAMSLGRVIVQESAPASFRARSLSVYSLGTLGGMRIGSIMMGNLVVILGPLDCLLVAVAGIAVAVLLVWSTTEMVSVNRMSLTREEK